MMVHLMCFQIPLIKHQSIQLKTLPGNEVEPGNIRFLILEVVNIAIYGFSCLARCPLLVATNSISKDKSICT